MLHSALINVMVKAARRAGRSLKRDLREEGGPREGADKSHTWIVDPLDGPTNFLHGIPQFAISIGLRREDTVIAALIYNPANDELYIAERGKGAFLYEPRLR